jgi:hypothetical protein
MTFSEALEELKKHTFVARSGWNGKEQYIGLQVPDARSASTLPYLWIRTVQGDRVPWVASQTGMLSDDWYCVTDANMRI